MAPPPSVKSGGNRIFDFRSGLRSSCATRNPPTADRTGASGAFSIAEGPRPSEAVVHARTHSPRSFTIHAPSAPLARSAATSARTPAPLPFVMARPSTAESVALPYTARVPAVHRRRARALQQASDLGNGGDLPGAVPVLLVLRVVGRPRPGVGQRALRFNKEIEEFCIAVAGAVGMILLGQVAKYTANRVFVRVRTELKEFVVVDERLSTHVPTPSGSLSAGSDPDLNQAPAPLYHATWGIVTAGVVPTSGKLHR